MKYLRFPVIRAVRHKEKWLSMDDYLKFVMSNLKYTVDMNAARKSNKNIFVNIPFVLH